MSGTKENLPFHKLLADIEAEVNWGSISTWKDSHFQKLSKKIYEKTSLNLSISTLKRVFGKIRTEEVYSPQQATLNGLAIYLGYKDWLDYLAANNFIDTGNYEPEATAETNYKKAYYIAGATVLLLLCIALYFSMSGSKPSEALPVTDLTYLELYSDKISSDTFPFEVNHTVRVKNYPIDGKKNNFFYEQGNVHVLYNNGTYNFKSVYKDYGLYFGKLYLNEQLVSSVPICVYSHGWTVQAFAPTGNKPASEKILLRNHADSTSFFKTFKTSGDIGFPYEYKNYDNFPFKGDALDLQFEFQAHENAKIKGNQIIFKLHGIYEIIHVNVIHTNISKASYLQIGNRIFQGKAAGLEKLRADFNKKVVMNLRSGGNTFSIYLNGEKVFETPYEKEIGDIRGVIIKSNSNLNLKKIHEGNEIHPNWSYTF